MPHPMRADLVHHFRDGGVGLRHTEQITLDFVTALLQQVRQLLDRFDALGGRANPHVFSQSDRRLDDCPALRTRGHFLDERLIDLDPVEPEGREIAEAGETGSEIVQRYPDAEIAQPIENDFVLRIVA